MKTSRIDLIRSRMHLSQSSPSLAGLHLSRSHRMSRRIHHRNRPAMSMFLANKETMQPEPKPESRDVWKVSQWKWNLDDGAPWWQRWYFRLAYLPFLLFSYSIFKVPAVKEVLVESDAQGNVRRTFRWSEDEGIFEYEDQADAGCLGEHWGYCKLPFGRLMPPDSAQYSGTIFPRKKNPKRWANPKLRLVIKDRVADERRDKQWAEFLSRMNQVLDR
jgi:hypothetical protein